VHDVIKVRFDRMEGVQFALFGLLSVLALLLFSFTNEDGSEATPYLWSLGGLFTFSILILLILLVYEFIVKPYFFSSSATRDGTSPSTVSSPDSFDVGGTTLPEGLT